MDDTIKIIEAIGKQWPFLLVLFFIIIFIIKWSDIWNFIMNFNNIKIKRGSNEVEFKKEDTDKTDQKTNKNQVSELAGPQKELHDDNKEDIDAKYYAALNDQNYKEAKKIFEKVLEAEPDDQKRKRKKIVNFYWRHIHGDTKAFDEFEKYIHEGTTDDEQKSLIKLHLSYFYQDAGNFEKAIELVQEAIESEESDEQKAFCVSKKAEYYYENGQKEKSINCLLENLKIGSTRNYCFKIYSSIAEFYRKEKNKFLESIAYQKALENKPNDTSMLFNTAYNYSNYNDNFNDLCIILYKKLVAIDSKYAVAFNNLGVAYKNLELPNKSVQSYKKAIDLNYTLASANIAYLLINDGFEEEAQDYLSTAQIQKEVHNNIYSASSKLRENKKRESEKEIEITNNAETKFRFFNLYGKAIFDIENIKINQSKNWQIDNNQVQIILNKSDIIITWEVGEEKHEIKGERENNAFRLVYSKPKLNIYSYKVEDKYTFEKIDGYGYVENADKISCLFFNKEVFIEFKIK